MPRSVPRPRALRRARALALAAAAASPLSCYSDAYLDGLCARTNTCALSRIAFHITTLELVDPHSYTFDSDLSVCDDSTDDFNTLLAQSIANFSVGHAIVVRPLDLSLETVKLQFVAADCFKDDMADGSTVCSDRNTPSYLDNNTSATNYTPASMPPAGACDVVETNSLNPTYVSPSQPDLPCLRSAPLPALTLRLAAQEGMTPLEFELSDVEIAAGYAIDEQPQRLLKGTLRGFMTTAQAMATAGNDFVPWNVLAGGLGCQPDPDNAISDLDIHPTLGQGVWMYFNFTAESVKWDTDVPDGEPSTSSGGSGSGSDGTTTSTTTTTTTTTGTTTGTTTATTGGSTAGSTAGTLGIDP